MNWDVRKANLGDASEVVKLARNYNEFLMPYVLNEFVVRNYIDQFMVAERVVHQPGPHYEVGGAVHYIPENGYKVDPIKLDRVNCFLYYVKQVPGDIIEEFMRSGNVAFLCQIVCPEKGSFYSILEELRTRYDELWCWMSINGPSYESYKRYGFSFPEEGEPYQRQFWNIYKCGYSVFALGKWLKEEKSVV